MSKFIKFIFTALILIIAIGGGLALYFKPNFLFPAPQRTDNVSNLAALSSPDDVKLEKTIVPNPTSKQDFTVAPFKATLFLDANSNGSKDDGESGCATCMPRLMVCSKRAIDSSVPAVSDALNLTIGSAGTLPTDQLFDGYVCWASLDDKKLFVAPYTILVGDSSAEVYIPVISTKAHLVGVNTHIKTIEVKDNSYVYNFDLLIPVLQTQFTSKKDVWLKFTPDLSKPDMYFVRAAQIQMDENGSVTDNPGSYYLKVDWGFSENYTNDKTIQNYTIIM